MNNSNYVKSHGVLLQGNYIQTKERPDVSFAEQLELIKKELDAYHEELDTNSYINLNTIYVVQTFTPEGNFGKLKIELDYTENLIGAIKRIEAARNHAKLWAKI